MNYMIILYIVTYILSGIIVGWSTYMIGTQFDPISVKRAVLIGILWPLFMVKFCLEIVSELTGI